MKNALATLTLSLALAACSGNHTTTLGFPAADVDDDASITPQEYLQFWKTTNRYDDFDVDRNGTLNKNEYEEAVDDDYDGPEFFHGLDRNQDGMLTGEEFIKGWFLMFDVDRNNVLSRAEYDAAINALDR
jgi:hypothetical protein